MKKNFYLMMVLMLGISCALWTGCSDDDETPVPPPEVETPDDTTNIPVDTVPVIPVDTIYQLSKISIGDGRNSDMEIGLTYTGKQLKEVTRKRGVNTLPSVTFSYETNKVTASLSEDERIVYTMNNGRADKADVELLDEEGWYTSETYEFHYNTSKMLETITMDGDNYYEVTFSDTTNNWKTLFWSDLYATVNCTPGDVKNNYSVDLNQLFFNFGDSDAINFAILAKLIPSTGNVLASVSGDFGDEGGEEEDGEERRIISKAAETVLSMTPTEINGKLSKLELKLGADLVKKVSIEF